MDTKEKKFVLSDNSGFEEEGNENDKLYAGSIEIDKITNSFLETNINDDDESYSAPVEVLAEFLSSFMSRDYRSALYYCKLILQYEPDNETVQDFYPLIEQKLRIESEESDESFDECCSESNSFNWSESSTEYFSSDLVETENSSAYSPLSSEEDVSAKSSD